MKASRYYGEKLFNCDECNFTRTTASDLETHILTHTGEKTVNVWPVTLFRSVGSPRESRKSVSNIYAYSRPDPLPPVSWDPQYITRKFIERFCLFLPCLPQSKKLSKPQNIPNWAEFWPEDPLSLALPVIGLWNCIKLRYESSTFILYKELSSPMFQRCQWVRDR